MKLLLDMNLPPRWVSFLSDRDVDSVHWSTVGDPRAPDDEIMTYARDNGFIVFTHDLDFSALLAANRARGPSVIQLRVQDVFPETSGERLLQVLEQFEEELEKGAIVSVDLATARVRSLPVGRS